jgi:Tfp pilus assembly protein PilV
MIGASVTQSVAGWLGSRLRDPGVARTGVRRRTPATRNGALRQSQRRGIVIVPVIVCVVIVMLISGALLRMVLMERRQARIEERRLQADWLAESGLERAWVRLASNADYRGETWQVAAEVLGGSQDGSVTIAVERVEGQPSRRLVRVRADYPREATTKARQTKHVVIELGPEGPGGTR